MGKQVSRNWVWLSMMMSALLLVGCIEPAVSMSAAELEPVAMKLSWHHSVQFLGFYVAQGRRYYAEEGLDVTIEPLFDAAEVDRTPQQVAAGDYDFSVGGMTALCAHRDASLTVIAAISQYSPAVFFARADSGIRTPADLAGHRVVVKNETWRALLGDLLACGGLTLDDVEQVPGGFDMTPFYEGEVDVWAGWLTNEVIRARQQGLDIVTLPLYEYGIRHNDNLVYTSRELATTNPDLAARFLRATLRGWEWAVENPTESVDLMLEMFPEMAAEREFHLTSFNASIPLIRTGDTPIGWLDCQAKQFHEQTLSEGFCTTDILAGAGEESD